MKQLYFLWSLIMLGGSLAAQDFHFSQYNLAPMYINPALTGNIENGQHRVILKHRNQWSSVLNNEIANPFGNQGFKTSMVSYDGRQCASDFFAYGLSVIADVVGEPAFRTYVPQASVAFHLGLKNDTYLSAGFQAGVVHHRFDNQNLTFDNQFDTQGGYDPNSNPRESFLERPSVTYLDLGGGLALYQMEKEIGMLKWGYNIGASVSHLGTRRDYTFLTISNPEALYDRGERMLRWTGHAAFVFYKNKANRRHDVTLRSLFMTQGPHWQYIPVVEYGLSMKGNQPFLQKVAMGVGARFTKSIQANSPFADAILINLQTDLAQYTALHLGYDVNISPLARASKGFGSFEISLILRFKTNSPCVKCFGF